MNKKLQIPLWVWKTMRISSLQLALFALCCGIAHAHKTSGQNVLERNISIQAEDLRFMKVLSLIEEQANVRFIYSPSALNMRQKVTIKATNKKLENVLKEFLPPLAIDFTVAEDRILLKRANARPPIMNAREPDAAALPEEADRKVSGKVTDEKGEALPGVSILVKGTQKGMITDAEGKFSIDVPDENAVLVFSFVGYLPEELVVGNRPAVEISLKVDQKALEEVVVVGYGTQSRANIIGSVATINGEKLTTAPVASTSNALTGRLPGLISKQENGMPGSDIASLSIRGFGSPLVIVDGIESNFNNIDANEIESVTILKDASAAVYGSRAGNGVILVTTKRGTSDKPTITLNSTWTFQGVTNMPKLANSGQWTELSREKYLNEGKPESGAPYTQEQIDRYYAGTDPDYPNTNWWKLVARDWSPQQQHNLSIRGGSEKIKYYGFLGYLKQETIFKKNAGDYQRVNLRSNIDAKILDNLAMSLDLSGIVENKDFPWRGLNGDMWQEYWITKPMYAPTLPDGRLANGGAQGSIGLHYMTDKELSGYAKNQLSNFRGTLSLKYDFKNISGLSAKAFVNFSQDFNFSKNFSWLLDSYVYSYANDSYTQLSSKGIPTLGHTDSKGRVFTSQYSLNFDRDFGVNHHITALAMYEAIDMYSDWISASRTGYTTTAIDYLFAGGITNQLANGSAAEMGRQGLITRLSYSYKSKYLLETSLRIDESAKFSKETRRGYFPSVSVGWKLSEENFMQQNFPVVKNLKLRASLSRQGKDDVGNFQYLSGYTYGAKYVIGSEANRGLVTTGMANPFLTWEDMTIYNLGLDFSLGKRNIYGELDVFYRKRDGIPGTKVNSLPSTFGANLPTVNLNKMDTRGFELVLGHEGQLDKLKWNISANLSWSRSKWRFYDEPEYEDPDTRRLNRLTARWTEVAFGYKSDGLFTSQQEIDALNFVYDESVGNSGVKPGDIRYVDVNKDGLLNWRDQVEIGKGTTPNWIGGVNMDLFYKNFTLSALFQGAFNFNQFVVFNYLEGYSELIYNERWTPENNHRNGLIPRLGGAYNNLKSDFYNQKADYLRLKTLSIGYNMPHSLLKKVSVKDARIYIGGTNLLTFSGLNKYNIDPEAPNGKSGYYYPQIRTLTFGINLSL